MYDENLGLHLGDGGRTIILDIDCPKEKVPKELETFFAYVENGEIAANDDFVQQIHQKVEEANRDTEVIEIMTLEEEMKVQHWLGEKKGREEGEKLGLAEGEKLGAAQRAREIANEMLREGISKELIAKITGLSVQEVEAL